MNKSEIDKSFNNKILFVIHGLTGGSDRNYIKCIMENG